MSPFGYERDMNHFLLLIVAAALSINIANADDPVAAQAHAMRAMNALQRADTDTAIAELTKSVELNPKFAMGWGMRASARAAKGDFQGAAQDATKALEIGTPFDEAVHLQRGEYRLENDDVKGAIADFEKTIELKPKGSMSKLAQCLIPLAKGKTDDALAAVNKLIEENPHGDWDAPLMLRGKILLRKGDAEKALADFESVLKSDERRKFEIQPLIDKAKAMLKKP